MIDADQRLASVVAREESRLRRFIRRRVPDPGDADDILQDVFYALVRANSLLVPIDHVTAWLFQVARNRISDFFRERVVETGSDETSFEDLLPSPDVGPDAMYARSLLIDEHEAAIDELPPEQRDVFVAHELEGRSFKDLAAASGVGVNTLLSRKRYAVLRLRERLRRVHDELMKP